MPSRARDRQLAKLAARRKAERRAQVRRRNTIIGVVGVVLGIVVLAIGFAILNPGGDEAASTSTPSVSASGSPSAAQELPTQTGQVKPQEFPPEKVACGGTEPAAATKPKPQFDSAPSPDLVLKPGVDYSATIDTSCGSFTIDLDEQAAPATVASFVFLAQQGFFDGQFVPRIDTSIDVIQAGDPTGTLSGGPGYSIPDELRGGETYGPGTVAMANAGPNTGGSQFFVIFGENGHNLDANPAYTVFGQVSEGLDVLKTIGQVPVQDPSSPSTQKPTEAVWIDRVTIQEKKKAPSASASPSG